ncbi:sensor histidine kinase [Yoonia sp. 208BN28-4]|uniref:sensor histidine kinase n=1 Tax=Yoonia sp. 208BN28-4 TaxID=3126505 RepID=UPI0030AD6B48
MRRLLIMLVTACHRGLRDATILAAAVFILMHGPAVAQSSDRLSLDPAHAPFDVAPFASALSEPALTPENWEERLGPRDLIALPQDAFDPIATPLIGFGANDSIFHLRIPVANLTSDRQTWILAFNDRPTGPQEAVLVVDDGTTRIVPLLSLSGASDWAGADRHVNVPFDMPPDTAGTLYVSFANAASSAPLSIEMPAGYTQSRTRQDMQIALLLGCLIGITLLTVLLIRTLRRNIALYYAGYVGCVTMHILTTNALFLPQSDALLAGFYQVMGSWWAIGSLSLGLLFQRAFFAQEPRISQAFRQVLLAAALGLLVVNFAFLQGWISPFAITVLAALCICLIGANGALAVVKGLTGAWPFLVGCLAITATLLLFAFAAFFSAYLSWSDITLILMVGLLFEAITLAFAMFGQVREIRVQREAALQSQLTLTREKLDMATRMAAAAHDIQQPLSSLRMAMTAPQAGSERSAEIGDAIDYLDGIVRSQMAETRADAQVQAEVDPMADEEFDLGLILEKLRAMFADEAAAKDLSLRVVQTSVRARGNAFALMRAVSNLVSNAIKNTAEGGVLIGCRRQGKKVGIWVFDTGPGMDEKTLAAVQKNYARHGTYDGHGLGLNIVQKLCADNGWRFEVASVQGNGSAFCIWISMA